MLAYVESVLSKIGVVIESMGYYGIGGGMMLESACIPLPSELVLPIGGFLVAKGSITMIGANIAVNLGSMIGSYLAYYVGCYGGRKFILNYGKYFFVSASHFHHAEKVFLKYGSAAVFFGRLLPVIRTFISLPAGIARMNPFKFGIYSLIGMIPWNAFLIYLGFKFNENYATVIRPIFKQFEHVVIAIIILIIVGFAAKIYFSSKKKVA